MLKYLHGLVPTWETPSLASPKKGLLRGLFDDHILLRRGAREIVSCPRKIANTSKNLEIVAMDVVTGYLTTSILNLKKHTKNFFISKSCRGLGQYVRPDWVFSRFFFFFLSFLGYTVWNIPVFQA